MLKGRRVVVWSHVTRSYLSPEKWQPADMPAGAQPK
jgi:hypothetical protein